MPNSPALKVKIQIYCGEEIAMGPGKADLLDAIAANGSISAAAKAMGMSYRRAWMLVEAVAGGGHERGARVTALGEEILRLYRTMAVAAEHQAVADFGSGLAAMLASAPKPSQH
jgi:molybdate transport system regulatory protein